MASNAAIQFDADYRLSGLWLRLAQVATLVLGALISAITLAFVPVRYGALVATCERDATALAQLGLTAAGCATFINAFSLLTFALYVGAAVVIVWRRPDYRITLVGALATVCLGAIFGFMNALTTVPEDWYWPITFVRTFGTWVAVIYLYIFPDGRFRPRWVLALAVGIVIHSLIWGLLPDFPLNPWDVRTWPFGYLTGLAWIVIGLALQIWRYRKLYSASQRQQVKWVLYGAVIFVVALFVTYLPATTLSVLQQPGLPRLLNVLVRDTVVQSTMLFFLACMAIAVLRSRLWDIDILIRRTLVYGTMTALLAVLYFGGTAIAQQIIRSATGQNSDVATVVFTLGVAALAFPLRNRIQAAIDRRFYRKKYDAQKTLEAFAARLQSAADVDDLAADVMGVIHETLQPTHVKVWLVQQNAKRSLPSDTSG